MAVKFFTGFDYENLTQIVEGPSWFSNTGTRQTTTTGRTGTGVAYGADSGGGLLRLLDAPIGPTVGCGAGFSPASTGDTDVMGFRDAGTVAVDVRWQSASRRLYVTRNGTTLATGSQRLFPGLWYHVELKVFIHDTTGTVEVRVQGLTDISATGLDTKVGSANTVDQFFIGGGFAGVGSLGDGGIRWDDVFVWDDSGSINTDFLGDCRADALLPSGAGNSTQWTASAGSNYQCVDESPPNDDTDYVSTSTAGNKDTYAMSNLPSASGTIMAVRTLLRARKDDAGSRVIRRVIRSGGTDYEGADISLLDTYVYLSQEILETDPATSARWTLTNVNAMEYGVKMVS